MPVSASYATASSETTSIADVGRTSRSIDRAGAAIFLRHLLERVLPADLGHPREEGVDGEASLGRVSRRVDAGKDGRPQALARAFEATGGGQHGPISSRR